MEFNLENDNRNGDPLPVCRAQLKLPASRGLNGREAVRLIRLEMAYDANLVLECCGQQANARSIMGLLSLEGEACRELTATATGPDAEAMIRAVQDLFANGFQGASDPDNGSLFRQKFAMHFNLM